MKKVLYLISAVTVLMVACTKSEIKDSSKPDCFVGNIKLSATHENGIVGKTTLESGDAVNWAAGDRISVLWNGGSVKSSAAASAGTTAEFSAEVESSPEYAVYPAFEPDASEGFRASWDGNTLSVTVPAVQDGSFASAAIEVAKIGAVSGSTGKRPVDFKNLGSLLEFSVESGVTKAVITAYGGKTIAGTASVSFGDDGLPIIGGSITDAGSVITLEGLSGIGPFYVATLPATLSDGFYIALYDSSDQKIGERFTGKSIALDRRKLVALGSIASTTISGKFVKETAPEGSDKSGSSWNNAMGYSDFLSEIATSSHNTSHSTTKIEGNYFVAAGTISTANLTNGYFIKDNTDIMVYGGYPSNATDTDLSGRNTVSNKTVFDGAGKSRLLVFWENGSSIKALFDGFTFQHADNEGSGGAGSALILYICTSATFNNCRIESNTGNSSTNSGGAIRINNGSYTFKNCEFINNCCAHKYGGVFSHAANSSTGTLTIDDCLFEGNSATALSGGVFYLCASSASTMISNCIFRGNYVGINDVNYGGGCIYLTGGSLSLSKSTFTGNYASVGGCVFAAGGTINSTSNTFDTNYTSKIANAGGACYRITGTTTLNTTGDTFRNNYSFGTATNDGVNWASNTKSESGSGSAIYAGTSSNEAFTIKANGCLFIENGCGGRGAVRLYSSNGTACFNSCCFYNNRAYRYASAIHNNGKCLVNNCVLQLNQNNDGTGASSIYGAGKTLVSNTCIRLSAAAGSGIYAYSGTTCVVNNTVINSQTSTTEDKQLAFKSNSTLKSYGHNIYSKLYQETDDTFSNCATEGEDAADHPDIVSSLTQTWDGDNYYVYWDGPSARFTKTTSSYVSNVVEEFDSAFSTSFKSWLQSNDLKIDGKTALEYDIRGIARSTTAIWPGSYDNSATTPLP